MRYLGVNATFHDPAAALVVDGKVVAAAEEERFSRRKHGKRPVPFSAWELPEQSMRWVLEHAGITPGELDGVGYSFDPEMAAEVPDDPYDHVRIDYVRRAPGFLAEALPGLDRDKVTFVPHHVAHAASSGLAGPYRSGAVLVTDGRGEAHSHLAGQYRDGELTILARQALPDSLGLVYESLTDHLGFLRSSDEFKVMALASYGTPRFADALRECVHATGDGGFTARAPEWERFAPRRIDDGTWGGDHADLAASVQLVVEETLVDLARWLRGRTGETVLTMAGGTALNCVANSRVWREAGFEDVWVQPASGDSGTALGAALVLAQQAGELAEPEPTAALGRSWSDEELARWLTTAQVPFTTPGSREALAAEVADILADNGVIAWFDGRSEFGPRALGRRSLLANPMHAENLERLNDVKGREQFRPVAPMVLEERAAEIFSGGPIPSPYMLFTHRVAPEWRDRIPTVTHVDGSARIQTVSDRDNPGIAALLRAVDERTGVPVVVNTSLNTAGRPMVDDPRDALELFGSAPVAALVLGPHLVRRAGFFAR
ncbi:carbamoyltransferase [Citricoccus sp. SGAir0253]|uniref:carbamoyltransferase family protein n=1 Tax=Citricoccus sp. SGAir0253 TaxID=2567881 RepID=UPI0010CCE5A3|nr:carbamoyltransferase C-terminal domain-containing protein [Citricoccus sp. SGAir0253]QCU78082.1 carbamoyltransferase [Citricoccus sp. SGAir0253]